MTEWLSALRKVPEGVTHAAGLITGLDGAFAVGFGRLGAEQIRALEAVGRTFSGTPLAKPLDAAIASIRKSELVEKHFVALAAARAALQGAQHDALAALVAEAFGREKNGHVPAEEAKTQETPSHHTVWLESARQWLMELAIAGFLQLSPEALLPFSATLEKIQGEPQLIRQSALLTGFFNELVASLPIAAMPEVPIFRWADLWSRAMVIAARSPAPAAEESVSGEFQPLGVDLRLHANFVSASVYGLLTPKGGAGAQVVRTTLSAFKVDVLTGNEVWGLFRGSGKELLTAIKNKSSVKVQGMSLRSTGDLVWDDKKAEAGAKFDGMAVAAKWLAPGAPGGPLKMPVPAGTDRHPALLSEPVYLEGYSFQKKGDSGGPELRFGSAGLPVAVERMGDMHDLSLDDVDRSQKMIGILRYDRGRFAVQPLAVLTGGKKVEHLAVGSSGASIAAGGDAGGRDSTLGILRERASKLLRAQGKRERT
ncbi:MAG TPA: hypothetical protein VE093_26125 [Polyangiaceae bacterium]|jgi:hypothetical protein|nr:hypothetical protein [Polyangiaceae bacterium]